ncbi:MAG: alpha/beta hydrolase [Solirubrobacterales bacterium]|nr:alpha/beta hydrolase [Solirubrobacterales bacterium]
MNESSLVAVSGGRVETLDLPGDPTGAPIVLLHEGLGTVWLWRGLPERLAAATGRRTVAFSRFGHGESDPPPRPRTPSFMHEEAGEALPELLAALGIERPVLVGHSDGASIALLHAAEHDVEALALLAPHVFVEEETLRGIRAARDAYADGGLRARLARHHRDPDAAFHGWCDVWLDPAFRGWNIEAAADAVTAPTLLVQGEDDVYGTLAQLDAIERRLRGVVTRLELPGGHSPHLEHPDAVVAAIAELAAA